MQRSSESIANLASALAKAQIELVNPEKSLVGTVYPEGASREGQNFNYASLASGLEIVRKTLGQHEIATVQSTAIDADAQIVKLTTLLAHSSGEWIASDWPVCAVTATATPRRMGAALTYARRYALFTLVGIAGEDDLDAPDLVAPSQPSAGSPVRHKDSNGRRDGGANYSSSGTNLPGPRRNAELGRQKRTYSDDIKPKILSPEQSAVLRNCLVVELDRLRCQDDAIRWARLALPEKAKLVAEDALSVEQAFEAKLTTFAGADDEECALTTRNDSDSASICDPAEAKASGTAPHSVSIDKSALALPEPRRLRDREHIRYVAQQPCLICGRHPSDSHHLRFAQSKALGRKVSDEFTVPLCRGHHRELHRRGNEIAWWKKLAVDPAIAARKLWLETHPLPKRPREQAQGPGAAVPPDDVRDRTKRENPAEHGAIKK